ncbi:MAG: glycosyltransferase [Cyanobacteria bacterium J06581_3]
MGTPISLVITSYNREHYLVEAIESVLSQTYQNFELLIWDDGSQDNSVEVAQFYADKDTRVRVEASPHIGLSHSLKSAIAATQHPYLGWVDSDDKLAPTALAETLAVLEADPQVGFVYTDYNVIDSDGSLHGLGSRCKSPYSARRLLVEFMTFHFRLIRRSVYNQVGGIDPTFETAEDYDLCLKLSEITNVAHIEQPLYFYRRHSGNVTKDDIGMIRWTHKAINQALKRRGLDDYCRVHVRGQFSLQAKLDNPPLVSIIIPCYNARNSIERCLKSCFGQSYSRIEIIVVENNSTDGTQAVLSKLAKTFSESFRQVHCQEQGQNYSRSCGFLQAKGDYIQWLDADDQLEPDKILRQITDLEKNKDFDIAYGDWTWCFYKKQKISHQIRLKEKQYDDFLLQLLMDNWRPPHAYLLRRSAAAALQQMNAWGLKTTACTDREYYTLAALKGFRFLYVDSAGVNYNSGLTTQVTRSTPYSSRTEALQMMFQRFQSEVQKVEKPPLGQVHEFLLTQSWNMWVPGFVLISHERCSALIEHKKTGEKLEVTGSIAYIVCAWLRLPSRAYTLEDHARRIVQMLVPCTTAYMAYTSRKSQNINLAALSLELAQMLALNHQAVPSLQPNQSLTPSLPERNIFRLNEQISSRFSQRPYHLFPLYTPLFSEIRFNVHYMLDTLRQQEWLERA